VCACITITARFTSRSKWSTSSTKKASFRQFRSRSLSIWTFHFRHVLLVACTVLTKWSDFITGPPNWPVLFCSLASIVVLCRRMHKVKWFTLNKAPVCLSVRPCVPSVPLAQQQCVLELLLLYNPYRELHAEGRTHALVRSAWVYDQQKWPKCFGAELHVLFRLHAQRIFKSNQIYSP